MTPGRRVERLLEVRVGQIGAQRLHVLVRRAGEGVGHEPDRIGERLRRGFEPDDPTGDGTRLVVEGNGFQSGFPPGKRARLSDGGIEASSGENRRCGGGNMSKRGEKTSGTRHSTTLTSGAPGSSAQPPPPLPLTHPSLSLRPKPPARRRKPRGLPMTIAVGESLPNVTLTL